MFDRIMGSTMGMVMASAVLANYFTPNPWVVFPFSFLCGGIWAFCLWQRLKDESVSEAEKKTDLYKFLGAGIGFAVIAGTIASAFSGSHVTVILSAVAATILGSVLIRWQETKKKKFSENSKIS